MISPALQQKFETSADQIRAGLTFAIALGDTIRKAGSLGIGEGQLYAVLMPKVSKEYFDGAVRLLEQNGIVSRQSNRLTSLI